MTVLRVLLVEDVDDLRATLLQALRLHGGFDVVADVADGTSALEVAKRLQPDAVVLDLGLPDLAGAELVAGVRAAAPGARIVVYTGDVAPSRAGLDVHAFVSKDRGVRYLVDLLADLGRSDERRARCELGPGADSVMHARRLVADCCEQWGCPDLAPNALLTVSELVTNALVHAGQWCELRVSFASNVLRIEVHDRGRGVPDLQIANMDSEGGRGLLIVSSLGEAWGVTSTDDGKAVWAELVDG